MMLSASDRLKVVGEAGDGARAWRPSRRWAGRGAHGHPHAGLDGLSRSSGLRERGHETPVIVSPLRRGRRGVRALRRPSRRFLLKDTPPADIVRAIERVAEGDRCCRRDRAGLIAQVKDDPAASDAPARGACSTSSRTASATWPRPSPRAQHAEIGEQLHLAVASVKAIVSRVLLKLEASNRVQVALLVRDASDD